MNPFPLVKVESVCKMKASRLQGQCLEEKLFALTEMSSHKENIYMYTRCMNLKMV